MTTAALALIPIALLLVWGALKLQARRHQHELAEMARNVEAIRRMMTTTIDLVRQLQAQDPEQRNREIESLARLWTPTEGTPEGMTPAPNALRGNEVLQALFGEPPQPTPIPLPQRELLFSSSPVGATTSLRVTRDPNQIAASPHDMGHLTFLTHDGTAARTLSTSAPSPRASPAPPTSSTALAAKPRAFGTLSAARETHDGLPPRHRHPAVP